MSINFTTNPQTQPTPCLNYKQIFKKNAQSEVNNRVFSKLHCFRKNTPAGTIFA